MLKFRKSKIFRRMLIYSLMIEFIFFIYLIQKIMQMRIQV